MASNAYSPASPAPTPAPTPAPHERIRILNAVPGGCEFVGSKRAYKLVKQRKAKWDGHPGASPIRLDTSHPTYQTPERIAAQERLRMSGLGYNAIRREMTIKEIRRIPVVGPISRII